ncbi:MAG: CPBP family intramembrane glutamic endopeptidase [Planctomycetota bacterium]
MADDNASTSVALARVPWREVLMFCVLAYAFSWLWWMPAILAQIRQRLTGMGTTGDPATTMGQLGIAIGMFGPMIAAVIMRLFVSREGVKASLGLRSSWRCYLIAVMGPMLFVGMVILVNHVTGLGRFVWPSRRSFWPAYALIWISGISSAVFAVGEEYGWRGYLLPRLLRLGEIRATFAVGAIWAFWHLPVVGFNYPGQNLLAALAVFTIFIILLAFPFTWLSVASGGSVIVVSVLHGMFNAHVDTLTTSATIPKGNALVVNGTGLTSAALLLLIVLAVYGIYKRPGGMRGQIIR